MNYNFHQSAEENPHRFLNVLLKGTYVRPHRHLTPPKAESFLILEGVIEVFLFDDAGVVTIAIASASIPGKANSGESILLPESGIRCGRSPIRPSVSR
jgi:cupin fold WbuC family metalloprotein